AASGSSNAPGTGITVIASCATPASTSASSATWSIRFVTPPLKRETTTPTERRFPSGVPSRTVNPSGTSTSPRTCSTLVSGGASSITADEAEAGHPSNGSPGDSSVSSPTVEAGAASSGSGGTTGGVAAGGAATGAPGGG